MLFELLVALVLVCGGGSFCSATAFEEFDAVAERDFYDEARTIFTYNGNYLLTLNTTFLIIAGVILGAITLAGLFLKTFLASLTTPSSSSYGHSSSGYGQNTYKQHYKRRRYQRSDDDFATLMHSLEQAFKKYSVNDIECQMYVACESAQINRQDENGPLAKIVYDIVNSMVTRRDFSETKLTPEMDGITQAFNYGQEAEMFGKEDACSPLRTKCYELQNKKQKNF